MHEDENAKQLRLAKLGIEAESFLNSALGEYMIARADAMIEENTDKLIDCEPDDIKANTKYRNMIQVGGMFKSYLLEVINDGMNAHNQIEESEYIY